MEEMEEAVNTMGLPSMLFGFNWLFLVNRKHDFLYEFNPVDSLNLCNFETREKWLFKEENKDPNQIDLVP